MLGTGGAAAGPRSASPRATLLGCSELLRSMFEQRPHRDTALVPRSLRLGPPRKHKAQPLQRLHGHMQARGRVGGAAPRRSYTSAELCPRRGGRARPESDATKAEQDMQRSPRCAAATGSMRAAARARASPGEGGARQRPSERGARDAPPLRRCRCCWRPGMGWAWPRRTTRAAPGPSCPAAPWGRPPCCR